MLSEEVVTIFDLSKPLAAAVRVRMVPLGQVVEATLQIGLRQITDICDTQRGHVPLDQQFLWTQSLH